MRRTLPMKLLLVATGLALAVASAACGDVVKTVSDQASGLKQEATQASTEQVQSYVQVVSAPMNSVMKARSDLAAAEASGNVGDEQIEQFCTRVSAAASALEVASAPPGLDTLHQQLATDLLKWSQDAALQGAAGTPAAQQILSKAPQISGWVDALSLLCKTAGIEQPAWLAAAGQLSQ